MTIIADLEVQLGQEDTDWGTAVALTHQLNGIQDIEISPIVDVQQVDQMCGTRIPARQSLIHMVGGEGSLTQLLNYDELPYWLQGMFGKSDTDDGMSTDIGAIAHVYNAPFSASDSADAVSYTLYEGDGTNGYSLNGATVNTISISGESGAPIEVSVDFIGKNVTTDVRGALSCADVDFAMGDHVSLYIDPGSDTPGTTIISNVGWSFEVTLEANRDVKRHLGDLSPSGYRDAKMSGTLGLSLEMSTITKEYIDSIIGATSAGVDKNIQLRSEVSSDVSANSFEIDFCGVLSGEPAIFTDVDGVVSMDLELMGQLNTGDTNWLTITVTNETEVLV